MKYIGLVLFVFSFSFSLEASLVNFCQKKKGTIVNSFQCPKSKLDLPITTCLYKNFWGQKHFVNGCSGPTGKYDQQLFKACVKHDLCYHHEPSSRGLTRKECDDKFYDDALRGCRALDEDEESKCVFVARALYGALRVIGNAAYHCADEPARYFSIF